MSDDRRPEGEGDRFPLVFPGEPEPLMHRILEETRHTLARTIRRLGRRRGHAQKQKKRRGGQMAGRRTEAPAAEGTSSEAPESPKNPLTGQTLQLLPGRLVSGDPSRPSQEIRFVRRPLAEQAITVGSADGNPLLHVRIGDPSVRPHHAQLCYRQGSWSIQRTATDGRVALNGEDLPLEGEHPLQDGDVVRIGDVLYRFRQP